MLQQTVIIDNFYKYKVVEILENGMGYVLILSLQEIPRKETLEDILFQRSKFIQNHYK